MSKIGSLGSKVIFETSDKKVFTFTNLNKTVSARWATHEVILGKPQSEFLGPDVGQISMNIRVDATLGVKPKTMLTLLEKYVEAGTALPLVVGGSRVGNNKWVITEMGESWDVVYTRGELVTATLNLKLQEYV